MNRHGVFFFCVKQKTAYEMRISDWSSDVCSSDLLASAAACHAARDIAWLDNLARLDDVGDEIADVAEHLRLIIVAAALLVVAALLGVAALSLVIVGVGRNRRKGGFAGRRSEERRVGKECVSTFSFRWRTYHN